MKKNIFLIFVAAQLFYLNAYAENIRDQAISGNGVKIEIYDDGKLSSHKIIANFVFYPEDNGKWRGFWQHIYIAPNDEMKDVLLKIESWSIDEGAIKNFQKFKGGCSFDLMAGHSFGKRNYQVVIKQKDNDIEVAGSALWYSEILKRELKMEWKSTEKLYFELPYNKIF